MKRTVFALTTTLLAFIKSSLSLPLESRSAPPGDAYLRTIYEFPNETWVENLAVRANGKVLVTLINVPEVWQIDPTTEPGTAELLYTFPDAVSTLGIAEYEPDVFAINVGNWSDKTFQPTKGSWSIWSLDLRQYGHGGYSSSSSHSGGNGVLAHKISSLPDAVFLNGLLSLPANPTTLLSADSGLGVIYSLDVRTGVYKTVVNDPALKPNASAAVTLGVNGIHVKPSEPGNLYFTNSFKVPTLGRIPIDPTTGEARGGAVTIVGHVTFPTNLGAQADDFALDSGGNAWVTSDPSNSLFKVELASGNIEVIAGGPESGFVAGDTSCNFGRTKEDLNAGRLYIATNGGIPSPPPGGIVGGKLIALDTAKL